MKNLSCNSVDDVLNNLQWCIRYFAETNNPMGYFTAIYKKTTRAVKEGIQNGIFEDNSRMEQMDIHFANLYFQAIQCFLEDKPAAPHWQITFDARNRTDLSFSQHFLSAANAHICYDLSLATEATCKGKPVEEFKNDFMTMNNVLAGLYEQVDAELSRFCPDFAMLIKYLDPEMLYFFGIMMDKNRDESWKRAVTLANISADDRAALLQSMMNEVVKHGEFILDDSGHGHSLLFKIEASLVKDFINFIFYEPSNDGLSVGDKIRIIDNDEQNANP